MSTTKILAIEGVNDEALCRMIEKLLVTMQGIHSAEINSFSQTLTLEINSNDVATVVRKVVETLKKIDANISVSKIGVGNSTRPHVQPVSLYRGVNPYGIDDDEDDEDDDDYDDEDDEDEDEQKKAELKERKQQKKKKAKKAKVEKPPRVRKPLPLSENLLRGIIGLAISAIIFGIASALADGTGAFVLSLLAYLLAAAFSLLAVTGKGGQSDFMAETVVTAVAAGIGFTMSYYRGAGGAMLVYLLGLVCITYARERYQNTTHNIGDIQPRYVTRNIDGNAEQASLNEIFIGDRITINTGETIPFDGKVVIGATQVDAAMLKGREDIRQVNIGDIVLCGYRNLGEAVTIEVERQMEESDAYSMVEMVRDDGETHTVLGTLAEKIAALAFAGMLVVAVLLMFLSMFNISGSGAEMMIGGMLLIALASSCGLGESVAMTFAYGICGAFERHILVRGGRATEIVAGAQSVAMGMVGTLTRGVYQITDILAQGYTESEVLEFAAYAESKSEHPLARAIVEKYHEFSGEEIDPERLPLCEIVRGCGVRAMVDRSMVLAGSKRLMDEAGIELPPLETSNMVVYVAVKGEYAGAVLLEDTLRRGALELTDNLKSQGINKIAILTGCDSQLAHRLAIEMQVDEVCSELTGKEKLNQVQRLLEKPDHKLLFAGTSREDEPFLAMADVGVGLGRGLLGSRFVSLMIPSGELGKLPEAVKQCKRVRFAAQLNLTLFVAAKVFLALLIFLGKATLFGVVVVNVAVSIILILNAIRAMYGKIITQEQA